MRKPNFFIVGKPKSGTTALHRMLDQHPDIYMSAFKEPHHFACDHNESALRRGRGYQGLPYRDRETYLGLFKDVAGQKIVGEASTNYLYSKVAAREIASFDPDARILALFREPVDFLHSLHLQFLRSGQENQGSLRKALALEAARKQGKRIPSATSHPGALFYSDQVKYCEQLERFLAAFGRDRVKVIIYEDFRDDNLAVCQDLYRFLGVDPQFEPALQKSNTSRGVRASRLANWAIYHWQRKEGNIKERAPRWITGPLGRIGGKLLFTGNAPPLDEATTQELRARFRPEVEALGHLLGVDLVKRWGYSDLRRSPARRLEGGRRATDLVTGQYASGLHAGWYKRN